MQFTWRGFWLAGAASAVIALTACGGSSGGSLLSGSQGGSGAGAAGGSSGHGNNGGDSNNGAGGASAAGGASSGGSSAGGAGATGGANAAGGASGAGGAGGASGAAGSGGGAPACNYNTPCAASPLGLAGCCADTHRCGYLVPNLGCVQRDQPGTPDSQCPPLNYNNFHFQGCCRSNHICGYLETTLGLGCVDPTQFGAPPQNC